MQIYCSGLPVLFKYSNAENVTYWRERKLLGFRYNSQLLHLHLAVMKCTVGIRAASYTNVHFLDLFLRYIAYFRTFLTVEMPSSQDKFC